MKEKIEQLEKEKAKKKKEIEEKEKKELMKREQAQREQEFIHKNEKLENTLTNILKKISKMKIIINELKRNINLEVTLNKNLIEEIKELNSSTNIIIRVENYEEGTVYYWNTETFYNRYDLMKELFNKFNDEELDIQNIQKEEDPLWDEGKPILLGYSFYKLEPVAYLMSNESELPILSPIGDIMGKLEMDIVPHDENGKEYEEVPELPSELIGQSLLYKVKLINIKNIPKNFSANLRIEYQCFYDHSIIKTKVYNENKEYNNCPNEKTNVEIKEEFEHKIDFLTKEDIDFLENEKICFKIYASEQVEKKGKVPIEEILRIIKEEKEKENEREKNNIENNINKIIEDSSNLENKNIIIEEDNAKKSKKNKKDCNIF